MADKWYELESYHIFLSSQKRGHYLPGSVYNKLIKLLPTDQNTNILDFGTGLGYAAMSLANAHQGNSRLHIFACDYQEKLLDQLWHTLTKKKIKNVTPFFTPSHSSILFPPWLPKMKQIICSLVLSSCENPEKIIQTIYRVAEPNAIVHIIDWNKNKLPQELENVIPPSNLMNPEQLEIYLTRSHYTIEKSYLANNHFFVTSARVPNSTLVKK